MNIQQQSSGSSKNVILYTNMGPLILGTGDIMVLSSSSTCSNGKLIESNSLVDNSEQYKAMTSDASSPIGKNDSSENYHPSQWAERAHSVQLASSPDRHLNSRPNSPLSSSPLRSSPIMFSPQPQQILSESSHNTYNQSIYKSSSQDSANSLLNNSNAKRGRPKLEEISELIMTGSSSQSSIRCGICNRVFPREKSLQAHVRTHTGERPYKCDFPGCIRAFVQSGQLRTHQRLHTGEKPFVCRFEGCENLFTHPNRRCSLHPKAGVRRRIPVLSVKKKENIRQTPNNKNTSEKDRSKRILKNITSNVTNSPVKFEPQGPIARKSVIKHSGRAARKLDDELTAAITPTNVEQNQENNSCIRESRNNMDILGALALMELAGVYPAKATNETQMSTNNDDKNVVTENENTENQSPQKLKKYYPKKSRILQCWN